MRLDPLQAAQFAYLESKIRKVETFYRGPYANIRVFEISGWV